LQDSGPRDEIMRLSAHAEEDCCHDRVPLHVHSGLTGHSFVDNYPFDIPIHGPEIGVAQGAVCWNPLPAVAIR
jgi:hypothetical protein